METPSLPFARMYGNSQIIKKKTVSSGKPWSLTACLKQITKFYSIIYWNGAGLSSSLPDTLISPNMKKYLNKK